jgi:hypothetical protein
VSTDLWFRVHHQHDAQSMSVSSLVLALANLSLYVFQILYITVKLINNDLGVLNEPSKLIYV